MRHKIIQPTESALRDCVALLTSGNCVVLPTETVYGLAGIATSDTAVQKIYEIKNRPPHNPLIIHVKNLQAAQQIGDFSPTATRLAEHFWPGSLTIIVNRHSRAQISPMATANLNTIAIRCPHHPIFQEILQQVDLPLAAPSANPSQYLSPTSAHDVSRGFDFVQEPILIIDGGPCESGLESTIIDMTSLQPRILRAGPLTLESLHKICPDVVMAPLAQTIIEADQLLVSPGLMRRHYAPRTPLRLNASSVGDSEAFLGFGPTLIKAGKYSLNLSPTKNLTEAAKNLFNYLHLLDDQHATMIAVAPIPAIDIGIAINDRLRRAATSS